MHRAFLSMPFQPLIALCLDHFSGFCFIDQSLIVMSLMMIIKLLFNFNYHAFHGLHFFKLCFARKLSFMPSIFLLAFIDHLFDFFPGLWCKFAYFPLLIFYFDAYFPLFTQLTRNIEVLWEMSEKEYSYVIMSPSLMLLFFFCYYFIFNSVIFINFFMLFCQLFEHGLYVVLWKTNSFFALFGTLFQLSCIHTRMCYYIISIGVDSETPHQTDLCPDKLEIAR